MTRLTPVCVLAFLAVFASMGSLRAFQACDQCDGRTAKCQSCCNDRGLLDAVDSLFGKFHTKTKKLINVEPKSKSCDQGSCDRASPCACKTAPTCGCDARSSCGCDAAPGYDSRAGNAWAQPVAPVPPTQNNYNSVPPRNLSPVPTPAPRSTVPPPVPLPTVPPPQTQDRNSDPFQDDTAGRVRRIPAAPVQYMRPKPTYGQSYDPQASSGTQFRFSDSTIGTEADVSQRDMLASQSSRKPALRHSPNGHDGNSQEVAPELPTGVVPASGNRPTPLTSPAIPLHRETRLQEAINPLRR